MKSVVRSAKPYWIWQILTGRKKVEVGKSFPTSQDWNKTVEMYCSKDMKSFNRIPKADREWMRKYLGKIACKFVCDTMTKARAATIKQAYYHNNPDETCMSDYELYEYAHGKQLYFWHISELQIYDTPKELREFCVPCPSKFADKYDCSSGDKWCEYFTVDDEGYFGCSNSITRPPQSWQYVEAL